MFHDRLCVLLVNLGKIEKHELQPAIGKQPRQFPLDARPPALSHPSTRSSKPSSRVGTDSVLGGFLLLLLQSMLFTVLRFSLFGWISYLWSWLWSILPLVKPAIATKAVKLNPANATFGSSEAFCWNEEIFHRPSSSGSPS